MDLELVWRILWDKLRLLWAHTVSRFPTSLVWNGQELEQVDSTRPTFKNRTVVSSAAVTEIRRGSPGMQAYTSANTSPGSALPRMLLFPQISLREIMALPERTIPKLSVSSPSERMVSPLPYSRRTAPKHPNRELISSSLNPWNNLLSDKTTFFPPDVVLTTYFSL